MLHSGLCLLKPKANVEDTQRCWPFAALCQWCSFSGETWAGREWGRELSAQLSLLALAPSVPALVHECVTQPKTSLFCAANFSRQRKDLVVNHRKHYNYSKDLLKNKQQKSLGNLCWFFETVLAFFLCYIISPYPGATWIVKVSKWTIYDGKLQGHTWSLCPSPIMTLKF